MKKEEELINRYLNEDLNEDELHEFDQLLRKDPKLRRNFYDQTNVISALEEEFEKTESSGKVIEIQPPKLRFIPYGLAVAASLILSIGIFAVYSKTKTPNYVATLKENENAAWESSLPTTAGSKLIPGTMNLKAGVATILFDSGAEITMEAPCKIDIQDPMRAKLYQGNVIVKAPESAKGFILETPDGYAVDHGTSFGVFANGPGKETTFNVLEGTISVHSEQGESLYLNQNESTKLTQGGIGTKVINQSTEIITKKKEGKSIRIPSDGKNLTIIRNNQFEFLDPDHLMVKLDTGGKPYERRSLINFMTSETDWPEIKDAGLRINLVPSRWGHRVYLPITNRFKVLAVAGFTGIEWNQTLNWEEAPKIEDCTEVGTFEIPRSQDSGSILLKTPELLKFLKYNQSHEYTFIIIRETSETKGSGLVHTFASDSHPQSSGPSLELSY